MTWLAEEFWTPQEIGTLLNLSEYNVKQHLIDGRIPGEKVCIRGCRRWAVRKTAFRRWVARKLRCKISHLRI